MTDTARLTAALAGRYALEHELGAGGMATVYLARDVKHDREVALKVLRPELAAVLGADRFLNEIKVTANLQHPHILGLIDSGEVDGLLYYVMPYVEGESLRDQLKREHQLPVDEAVRITHEVADALEYAHGHGIVHRDIKPENILVHGGHALVADFGIALAVSTAGGTRMTETGLSLGTPQYMAPEQAMGEREITPRADIYALGVVLYEMLTGDPPFTGSTVQAIVSRVMTETPRRLAPQRHTIPANVEAAVLKALEKLPADRFSSAADFAAALGNPAFTSAGVTAATVASRGPARRLPGAAVMVPWVIAGLAVAVLAWNQWRPRPPVRMARFEISPPPNQAIRTDHEGASIALSADGTQLVYVGRGEHGRVQLFLRNMDQLDARALPGTEGAESPFFSPDGQWVAFFADEKLKKVPLAGGPPLVITDAATERGGTWGPGDVIVFSNTGFGPLRRVSAGGGTVDTVTTVRTDSGENNHRWPVFLPGGRGILFVIQDANGFEVAAVSLRDRKVVKLLRDAQQARYAPSGHLVYGTPEGTLVAVPFDAAALRVTGPPTSLLRGLVVRSEGSADFDVSPAGHLASIGGQARRLVMVDRRGGERLVGPELQLDVPRFSPDGRRIAFVAADEGVQSLRVLDVGRGTLSRFTSEGQAQYPEWTPDGQRIAFAWSRPGDTLNYDLFWLRADGAGGPEPLLRAKGAQWEVAFAPDGRRLAYRETDPVTQRDLWLMPLDSPRTPRPFLKTPFNERAPAISPDGRWLAYVSNESGVDEIYVRSFPEPAGRVQVSAGGGREPRWGRSGRTLYYRTSDSLIAVAVRTQPTFLADERRALFASSYGTLPQHADYDVSPDEQHFVFVKQGAEGARLVVTLNAFSEVRAMRSSRP